MISLMVCVLLLVLKVKKVKVHILDIASLRSKTPTQKHSGMARSLGISPFYLHTHTFFRNRNEHAWTALPASVGAVIAFFVVFV